MSYEPYVKSSRLNSLISRLNDTEYKICRNSPLNNFRSGDTPHKETLKNIGSSVECAYRYLTAFDDETLNDLCKYLNLWLDEQKSIYVNDNFGITDEEWYNVENLWNQIEAHDPKCARQQDEHNISQIGERKKLMTYCINRNYIRGICKPSIHSGVNISRPCHAFNEFIEKHYKEFYTENRCFGDPLNSDNYGYSISEDCDLNNMAKTFPRFDSTYNQIVYNDESREPIKKCQSTEKVEDGYAELGRHTMALDLVPSASTDSQAASTGDGVVSIDDQAASAVGETGFEDSRSDSIEIASPSHPELSSTEDGPSKPIYYAGLSVSGVFFTSMVLYKYTALGSFIRSLVSKKEKLRQTTNKHLAQQWLEKTSEYMDPNSENSHYNFPYQSMQN
ncbi:Plasmodium vivax Vir protein, putative [Plasmodium vivax]|uniref:Vir protein, putative n=1 Tax=Plasmodium vivax TaxID=5855 RepID=A0A1G4E795_PLAVI|nr:Plasmodium vivax Vir protein, putative [Plasmodium vivax]